MATTDDQRTPLVPPSLPGWRAEVAWETTSTNAEAADRFRAGERHGLVLAAEHQSAGRGRLGREWVSPPRASLTVSFLLEPAVEPRRWTWLPLLTGVAVARVLARVSEARVALKWPNDVLLVVEDASGAVERKVGGILLERVEHGGRAAAVVGIGVNVHQDAGELPVETATSLALAGAGSGGPVDRSALLAALVEELGLAYDDWGAGEDPRPAYLSLCSTLGRTVRVTVPGDPEAVLEGEAVDVDADGRLVVRTPRGEEALGAGDVVHVRPVAPGSVG